MTRVVLASQSRARREVLTGAGVGFVAVTPGVDEDAAKAEFLAAGRNPRAIAEALAEAKALAVSEYPSQLVVGADQTLEFEGRLYDKVADLTAAAERLRMLRAKTHALHSAVVVAQGGIPIWRETATATLVMRDFSDSFLDAYLAEEGRDALGSVGCYRLEGPGAQLFESIDGDYFAILGLPLLGLLELLREKGVIRR